MVEDSLKELVSEKVHYFKHPLSSNKDTFSSAYNKIIEEFPYKIYWYEGLVQTGYEISKDGTIVKKYEVSSSLDICEEYNPIEFKDINDTITFLKKETKWLIKPEV